MYFEIYPTQPIGFAGRPNPFAPRQWRWRLRAGNNKIVAQGEAYHNRQDCLAAIALLKGTNAFTQVRAVAV